MRLLLLSNSTSDNGFLVDWLDLLGEFLRGVREALFIPYAAVVHSWDSYEARVGEALASKGIVLHGIHRDSDPVAAVRAAGCVVVGGGNTFNLLYHCRRNRLLPIMEERVRDGLPYVGWSAGANIASPTIRTTNDMPVIDPEGFDALGLVSFQINPHFTDALPTGHHGETRTQRLAEFTALNPGVPVLALPEGCYVRVEDGGMMYGGKREGAWVAAGREPAVVQPGPLRFPST